MAEKLYVGDIGTVITCEVSADITGYSAALIKYKKPDDTTGSFTATVSNATTGTLTYTLVSGDLDQAGDWTFWADITMTSTDHWTGDAVTKTVYAAGT